MAFSQEETLALYKMECQKILSFDLQREGSMKFFAAACAIQDGTEADKYRAHLHNILDMILDAESQKMTLLAQLSKS